MRNAIDLPIEGQPLARQVSGLFYSNCLIQAVLHKLLHPFKTKIVFIPAKINESRCPHFFWCDRTGDYDFAAADPNGKRGDKFTICEILFFKGYIRKRGGGFALKYKVQRKRLARER